ncbi:Tubulin-specific chaperone D OS=Bos taurus GN=TBCD PE=1 SV=1 [Rhizoctonia solani AG-1 IB]|uniref:Tubulin-specific chaperone D n=1 Tax=Thanatephorus cucumeris (strain AG1-IB / isolate 7/3/14) TaxID=1108050 RepID=A0A0B7G062_THACB|nr:Tubulin-specific chaperone D OS=Bos taurus GN=TBCD PE=1 SV=1 [Rhizoctonia solani AG-1 IB]
MDDAASEDLQLSGFAHEEEFMNVLKSFLDEDTRISPLTTVGNDNSPQLSRLTAILDEYQEQPYLLDPFLNKMVEPVVEELKNGIRVVLEQEEVNEQKSTRLYQLATLMYWYSKTRGMKSIVPFFPHTVQDLPLAIRFAEQKEDFLSKSESWGLRYVTAMWLSLICMIPFDLARFDEPDVPSESLIANRLDRIGKSYLAYPGIERESAAMLLARLYMRTDMLSRVPNHIDWAVQRIQQGANTFEVIGIMHIAAIMMKAGGAGLVLPCIDRFRGLIEVLGSTDTSTNLLTRNLTKDTIVRKYRIKLIVRLAMCELPGKPRRVNIQNRALVLPVTGVEMENEYMDSEYDEAIPESIEEVIEQLINGVQDQDTAVRYSSAKGIARVASRLPEAFSDEIVDAVAALFSIHGTSVNDNTLDLPPAAEMIWHGACLSYAELARCGMISASRVKDVVGWICKAGHILRSMEYSASHTNIIQALSFDVRKGAHSVGSSVRDSASYVLWALVRAQSVEILSPYLLEVAVNSINTSLFDREVHVRRAASAAYQEAVGRTGVIPHGIDVLRATDFYAVSIRRNAFLVAAPQVAVFAEYQQPIIEHILKTTLRHWDPKMRILGSQALRVVCDVDLGALGPRVVLELSSRLRSIDTNEVHGALLSIAEISKAFKERGYEDERLQCFKQLSLLPSTTFQKFRGEMIVEASCYLIAESISLTAVNLTPGDNAPDWRYIILDNGLKHQSEAVQAAASAALSVISGFMDCAKEVQAFVQEFQAKNSSPVTQSSISQVLGALAYDKFDSGMLDAIDCLVGGLTKSSETYSKSIETRRNCITSLSDIIAKTMGSARTLSPLESRRIYATVLTGFGDYTVDPRGDVGSWVRMATLRAITSISQVIFRHRSRLEPFDDYIPPNLWHKAIGKMLKQGVERLDSVRVIAGEQLMHLLWDPDVRKHASGTWAIPGLEKLELAFPLDQSVPWSVGEWLFPRIPPLLDIAAYRGVLLSGIITSLASRNESAQLPLADALCAYANALPISPELGTNNQWSLLGLMDSLLETGRSNASTNSVMVPLLKTIDILFGGDVFGRICSNENGVERLTSILGLAGKGAEKLKNVERITAAMKVVVDFIALAPTASSASKYVESFLGHRFPRVGADTAEALYLLTQTQDLEESDELEALLLQTTWINIDEQTRGEKAKEVVALLHAVIGE